MSTRTCPASAWTRSTGLEPGGQAGQRLADPDGRVADKAGIGDLRESPALEIIEPPQARGGDVSKHDPHVPELPQFGLRSAELGGDVGLATTSRRTPRSTTARSSNARPRCSTYAE
jgi:hypothetical protein